MRLPSKLLFVGMTALLLTAGCASPYTRVSVHHDDVIQVSLRALNEGGSAVDRGFRHPATISNVRLAHILSAIDVRMNVSAEGGGERQPAIHTQLVYLLGDHLSAALKQADSTQEVVIQVTRKERNLGVFTQKYLTSFVAWVDQEDRLQIHLSRSDWAVPKSDDDDEVRDPVVGEPVQRFRVIGTESIDPIGAQSVAAHWRDSRFRKGANLTVGAGGGVQRRKILLESPDAVVEDDVEPGAPMRLPSDPAVLRALADLEDERRSGTVSESAYQQRRRALLRGELPE